MSPVGGQEGAHLLVKRRIESGLGSQPGFAPGLGLLQRGMKQLFYKPPV
jgi:hypothetical protein